MRIGQRGPRLALAALGATAALGLAACGDDKDDGGGKPKVGDCTNQSVDGPTGLEDQYKVVPCDSDETKSEIVKDVTGEGVTACSENEAFFDVKEGEFCVETKL